MAKVIYISGSSGTGKSTLCTTLAKKYKKDILNLECDSFYQKIYQELHKKSNFAKMLNNYKKFLKLWNKLTKQAMDAVINENKSKYKVILIDCARDAGKPTKNSIHFCVRVENIKEAYERFLKREFDKFIDNKTIIDNIFKNNKDINTLFMDTIVAINHAYFASFDQYKKQYEENLKHCKKKKARIATIKEITKFVESLL
jgi:cytidylate kinase